jgi:hypothetical protein
MNQQNPNRVVRKTKAEWEYMDGEEIKTREIRVLYRSLTIKEEKELREQFKAETERDPHAILWVSEEILPRLVGLKDLPGAPEEITLDWLEDQETKNLRAIEQAIKNDLNPEKKLPSGSPPEK